MSLHVNKDFEGGISGHHRVFSQEIFCLVPYLNEKVYLRERSLVEHLFQTNLSSLGSLGELLAWQVDSR